MKRKNSKDIGGAIFLWFLFFGYPIVLSISVMFNSHFRGFISLLIVGFFLILVFSRFIGLFSSMYKIKFPPKLLLFLLVYLFLIFLSIILSNKYGTSYWMKKVGITIVYFVLPIGSVIFFNHNDCNVDYYDSLENIVLVLVLVSILIGFFYIYRFNSIYSNSYFVRLAGNSNSIDFSYAYINLFLFVAYYAMKRASRSLSFIFLIMGIVLSFLTGTRQVVVYTFFFILFFVLSFFKTKKSLDTSKNKNKLRRSNSVLIILILLLIFLLVHYGRSYFLNLYNWAFLRWKLLSLQGRLETYMNALNVFKNNPIFGCFAYETPGFWAHNTILDVLAQFGLVSAIIYTIILIKASAHAFRIIFNGRNKNILTFLAIYFISSLSVALTISDFLFNPAFNFTMMLLFLFASDGI